MVVAAGPSGSPCLCGCSASPSWRNWLLDAGLAAVYGYDQDGVPLSLASLHLLAGDGVGR
jgi:hypothetical protein